MYEYSAQLIKPINADLLLLKVDVGLRTYLEIPIKLYGITLPSIYDQNLTERELAVKACDFIKNTLGSTMLILKTHKNKKNNYDPYLGEIIYMEKGSRKHLSVELIKNKFAKHEEK